MNLIPPLYRWLACILLLAALLLGSYLHGRHTMAGEFAKDRLADERLATAQLAAKQRRIDALAAAHESARAVQQPKDRIIYKEIVKYETTVPADRRCTLDSAWRLLHDAAATGQPADPARLAASEAATVTDAAALDTVGENYNRCRDAIEQVTGWQAWYDIAQHASHSQH